MPARQTAIQCMLEDHHMCAHPAHWRGSRNMTRRLFRTIYGAEFFQLPFNSSCTKEHPSPVAVRVQRLARLAKSPHYCRHYGNTSWASCLLILRQGCRPFSEHEQPATVAPNFAYFHSHSTRWRKFMNSSSLPFRAQHRHYIILYQHTTHFSLRQIVDSWDLRHQRLWRSYAKKGRENQYHSEATCFR